MSSRMIKNRLMVGAAALPVLLAGPAMAEPQTYNWAGFYAGLNGGGAWSSTHQTTTVPCTEPLGTGYICATALPLTPNAAAVGAAYSGSFSGSGFTGGVQAGYNWQTGAAVYGVELDLESLPRVSAQRAGALPVGFVFPAGTPFSGSTSVGADWLFTARGRLGWAFNNLLVYGTGGLAETRLKTSSTYADSFGGVGSWSSIANKTGWTAGAGVEYALSKEWTIKAEYLYVNFGSVTAPGTVGGPLGYASALSTSNDLTAQIARVGVNYKF
jgi:outer membrane immunogenic protein